MEYVEVNIDEEFNQFLKLKNIELHKGQGETADVILKQITDDAHFLLSRRSGKTFLFNLLDEFFSSIEILDPQNLILANEDRFSSEHAPVMSTH